MPVIVQVPSIILPTVWTLGTETETIANLLEHTSIEFQVDYLEEKEIHIVAQEISIAPMAIAGPLWCWVELSPYPSANSPAWAYPLPFSAAYWAAIGGGGGALPAMAPFIEAPVLAGAPGLAIHTIILPWAIHSPWARLVMQTPVSASLPNAYWMVQAMTSAKTA